METQSFLPTGLVTIGNYIADRVPAASRLDHRDLRSILDGHTKVDFSASFTAVDSPLWARLVVYFAYLHGQAAIAVARGL
jgi:hypothetical protein